MEKKKIVIIIAITLLLSLLVTIIYVFGIVHGTISAGMTLIQKEDICESLNFTYFNNNCYIKSDNLNNSNYECIQVDNFNVRMIIHNKTDSELFFENIQVKILLGKSIKRCG